MRGVLYWLITWLLVTSFKPCIVLSQVPSPGAAASGARNDAPPRASVSAQIKDIADLAADFATLAAVVIAGIGIAREIRKNREEREHDRHEREEAAALRAEDLRWRRANAARELVTDIHNNEFARRAVELMDWCDDERPYRLPSGTVATIAFARVGQALGRSSPQDEIDSYLVDCFDWFLYYLDRLEHYLQNGLILFEDVADTLRPYVRTLQKYQIPIESLLEKRCYDGVPTFLSRFSEPVVRAVP